MSARCKTCGARIEWVKSALTGKPMPLDAAAVDDGNIVLREGRAVVFPLGGHEEAGVVKSGVPRFRSHFSTCPDAADHRKPRGT